MILVWGGNLIRALEIGNDLDEGDEVAVLDSYSLSNTVEASDWILDLRPGPAEEEKSSACSTRTFAAVTAHNALVELTLACEPGGNVSKRYQTSRPPLCFEYLLVQQETCAGLDAF